MLDRNFILCCFCGVCRVCGRLARLLEVSVCVLAVVFCCSSLCPNHGVRRRSFSPCLHHLAALAGVPHGFSTRSVLGPFFAVWLPYLNSLLDVACQPADPSCPFMACPRRFPLDFAALRAYVPLLWSGLRTGIVICCFLALLPSEWFLPDGSCLIGFSKEKIIIRFPGNMRSVAWQHA